MVDLKVTQQRLVDGSCCYLQEIIREGAPCFLYFDIGTLFITSSSLFFRCGFVFAFQKPILISSLQNVCLVEFDQTANEGVNGDELMTLFVSFLCLELKRKFNIHTDGKDMIDLESSTSMKFSRHLIVKSCIFENNSFCGNFVRYLEFRLEFFNVFFRS